MFSKTFTGPASSYSILQSALHYRCRASVPTTQAARYSALKVILLAALFGALTAPNLLWGHGFEGDRFFPPTIQTDDPFATDELSLPTISSFNNPAGDGSPKTREIDISMEFDKEIFPRFALGVSAGYTLLNPKGGPSIGGFDNVSLSAKYQLWEVPSHEFILSAGMEWEIGGSGRQSLTNNYSTLSPILYFGKGFGDLPDSVKFLKPIAITGTVGQDIPIRSLDSNVLEWGIAIEYSLPYLQQHVKDVGIPRPFRDMIPLVELSMQSQENRGGGLTTGTINPGVPLGRQILPDRGGSGHPREQDDWPQRGGRLQCSSLHRRSVSKDLRPSALRRWRKHIHLRF